MPEDQERFYDHRSRFADRFIDRVEYVDGLDLNDYVRASMNLGRMAHATENADGTLNLDFLIEYAKAEHGRARALPRFLRVECGFTDEEVESVEARLGPLGGEVVEFPRS